MRNLTKTLAVVSILAPASAYPLGIGDIKLHSALNQNLNAEIPLVVSTGENVADIKVSLAPPDKFDEAGVPWSYFLSKIKFEPVAGPNGSVVIKLSSKEVLKEPVLDLLLEVSWPKGNLYREFTVLVDPPAAYSQATIPVSTRVESYEPEQDIIPQRQQAPKPKARPHINAGAESQHTAGVENGYVIVKRNDSLWNVARRVNSHRGVTMEQMMMAMYQQNPDAFYKQNVNALIAGKKLKIPEKEAILKLSKKEALAEFNRQTEAWKNHVDAPVPVEKAASLEKPAPVEKPVPVEKPTPAAAEASKETAGDNHLKLVAPTEATVTENVAIAAKSDQATADKPAPDVQQTKVEAAAPAGTNGAGSADAALQQKVAELENQLATMQRLMALKDEQLASLQNSPASPAAQQQPAQPPAVAAAAKPASAPVVQPQPESGDSYYLGVGAAGAVILSLLGWLWWRKRKIDEEMNAESMFASSSWSNRAETAENLSVPVVDNNMTYNVGTVGESSFLSEFTPSDFGAFDTDQSEIDPISEADVYLAYGRYQQAEELMRQAIKDQPDRDECMLKLLEIFYANENKQAFETYAGELATAGKKNEPDFWAKVVEMGSEICPDSALFSSGFASHESAAIEESSHTDLTEAHSDNVVETDDASSMDFDMFAFESPSSQEAIEPEGNASDSDMVTFEAEPDYKVDEAGNAESDFDLAAFEVEDDQKNNDSLDFDLNLLSQEPINFESGLEIEKGEPEQEIESFDFDFNSNETEAKGIGEFDLSASGEATENFDDFNLSSSDLSGLDKDDAGDDFEFNFGLDMPSSENQDADLGTSELTDMDEWETKLDLAKAYIDMGDAEAAKDIADEVYEKGSSEQRKVALELLDELK